MTTPIISVVIPTYNRADMIGSAIESVQRQTFEDWELIIVDDASTDHTGDAIQKYLAGDSRIRCLRQATNRGGNAARNRGITESVGRFVAFLDDDDTWKPEKLHLQNRYFTARPGVGLVYCGFRYVDFNSKRAIREIKPLHQGNVLNAILRNNILGSPTPLIKRECFEQAGLFDEDFTSCQDWDMWIRVARIAPFGYIDDALADVSIHGSQISGNLESKIDSREKLLNKYHGLLEKIPKTRAYHLKRLAVLYALNHSPGRARRCLIRSLGANPISPDCVAHLLLSIAPPLHRAAILRFGIVRYGDAIIYH